MFTGTLAYDYSSKLKLNLADYCLQPKYDGVRVQILPVHTAANAVDKRLQRSVQTQTCTRSNGYIPNDYIRSLLDQLPIGLDGELMAADSGSSGEAQFSTSMSAISAKAGQPDFKYVVYDYTDCAGLPYAERMYTAWQVCVQHFGDMLHLPKWLHFAPVHEHIVSYQDLDEQVAELVALGHEGAILRNTKLQHVQGRSSRKVPAVLRIKAWSDAEFTIVNVIEETYHDCERNRRLCPELIGTGKGFASSFVCAPEHGFTETFRAPLAVTDEVAKRYWEQAHKLIGQRCTVKWLAQGNVSRPRLPGCKSVRYDFDLDA
jgi:ATP-dependent DNA ligase